MNLNGQEYWACYLTPKEKSVVDAMRAGANIQVRFASLETYQEVD